VAGGLDGGNRGQIDPPKIGDDAQMAEVAILKGSEQALHARVPGPRNLA
jgi:hypothetical protein